jgi:capsular exopolysaccharide synthesis family protein
MSKIFEVLKKDSLIDFGDIYDAETDSLEPLREAEGEPTDIAGSGLAGSDTGRIVKLRVSALAPILPFDAGHQAAADQYRIVRTKILHHPQKPRLIVVSSGSSGDGKTVTSVNVAASLALKADARVLLVDGDLCRPCIADLLGIQRTPGLVQVLTGVTDLESAIVHTEQLPNLFVLSSGGAHANAAELLDSANWRVFIEQVRAAFSHVIFDAPPVAMVADYELLQLACDGVLLVFRPDHTNRAACMKSLDTVPGDKLLGVVLNGVEDTWPWKSPAYGYYPKHSPGVLEDES